MSDESREPEWLTHICSNAHDLAMAEPGDETRKDAQTDRARRIEKEVVHEALLSHSGWIDGADIDRVRKEMEDMEGGENLKEKEGKVNANRVGRYRRNKERPESHEHKDTGWV